VVANIIEALEINYMVLKVTTSSLYLV